MTAALADPAVDLDLDVDLDAAIPCHGKIKGAPCPDPAAWLLVHRCTVALHQHLYCETHCGALTRRLAAGERTACGAHNSPTTILRLVRL